MLRITITFLSLLVILFASCTPAASGEELKSEKHRVTAPQVSDANLTALGQGNTTFALNLYQNLKTSDGNIFFSPFSISMALAMVYAGARNETEKEIANTLHFNLPQSQLHPTFNKLDSELNSRGKSAKGKDDKGFRLNVVNAIWGQKDYQFLPGFLDVLAQNYGAGLRLLNFLTEPEPSRQIINKWVSDQTEQRIKNLIPQGSITPDTMLVLTNAIYFNAAWLNQFQKNATAKGSFYPLDGNVISTDLMHQTESIGYMQGNGYQVVELPYDGNELSMIIIVPDKGGFHKFEDSLDTELIISIKNGINNRRVALTMPKFEFESSFNLNDELEQMGMVAAFTPYVADFSGMNGNLELYISDVIHKAFVSVDEEGTEAAAATAVTMRATAMPSDEIVELKIDRPFIFLIQDIPTGSILFIGRVLNPS